MTHADDWQGDEAYVAAALDAPGYMAVPAEILDGMSQQELLAGVHLGYIRRMQPADAHVRIDPDDYKSFLRKLSQA